MTSFSQLGDPVCPVCPEPEPCLCEHHGAVYAKWETELGEGSINVYAESLANDATIVQVPITITETCCVIVNAAIAASTNYAAADFEIERPKGTIRTQQEDMASTNGLAVMHHAAWEVLTPGTYTYFLVNRSGASRWVHTAWLKIIASDCEG